MSDKQQSEFEKLAPTKEDSFLREILGFMAHNKKWWLLPLLIFFAIFGALSLLAGSPVAPFIYTIF